MSMVGLTISKLDSRYIYYIMCETWRLSLPERYIEPYYTVEYQSLLDKIYNFSETVYDENKDLSEILSEIELSYNEVDLVKHAIYMYASKYPDKKMRSISKFL